MAISYISGKGNGTVSRQGDLGELAGLCHQVADVGQNRVPYK
jgi:hypothetical protein